MFRLFKTIPIFHTQKKHFLAGYLALTFFSVSCDPTTENVSTNSLKIESVGLPLDAPKIDSSDALLKSIIDISANDFHQNQEPLPVAFRNVQLRYSIKPNQEILYLLCGQFTTQTEPDESDWIDFTTIKNSNYEQWIGTDALTYCEQSTELNHHQDDIGSLLLTKLNSILLVE